MDITWIRTPTSVPVRRRCAASNSRWPAARQSWAISRSSRVEDLQVEFGADFNEDQNADYFVQPNTVIPAGDQIVAVRVWLLVRAEQQETGLSTAALTTMRAAPPTRRQTRSAGSVSKTIALRNTRR